jgi:hypothetical protein
MPLIKVNMQKATEIKKDMLRADRQPLLADLDVQMLRAMEVSDSAKQAEILAKKQALRDITTHPDLLSATTPEELKAFSITQA